MIVPELVPLSPMHRISAELTACLRSSSKTLVLQVSTCTMSIVRPVSSIFSSELPPKRERVNSSLNASTSQIAVEFDTDLHPTVLDRRRQKQFGAGLEQCGEVRDGLDFGRRFAPDVDRERFQVGSVVVANENLVPPSLGKRLAKGFA